MLNKYLDYSGSKMFLGLESTDKNIIINNYWSYINWTADKESHLNIIEGKNTYFGYFKVLSDRFEYWLEKKNLFAILQKMDKIKGRKLGDTETNSLFEQKSRDLAAKELSEIKVEFFLGNMLTTLNLQYNMSNIDCRSH